MQYLYDVEILRRVPPPAKNSVWTPVYHIRACRLWTIYTCTCT